jgi:hypothetical protein
LDKEFLILSAFLLFLGITGIVLFNGQKTPTGDGCNCIISTPEASAMQGTAAILLVFGILFLPVGIMKGGLPSFRRQIGVKPTEPPIHVGKVFTPIPISSSRVYGLGTLLLFVGIYMALPGLLIIENPLNPFLILGIILAFSGAYLVYRGTRIKSQDQ